MQTNFSNNHPSVQKAPYFPTHLIHRYPSRKKPGIANIGGYKEYYRIITFKCIANSKATMKCNTVQQRRNHLLTYKLKVPSICLGKKNE